MAPLRMILREIALLETARLQNRHRQRIAHHEHRGGAGGGREIERTRFLRHVHVEHHIAVARERGFRVRPVNEMIFTENVSTPESG